MKPVLMFVTSWCPYCKMAFGIVEKLRADNDAYKSIEIKVVDEDREAAFADSFDYYLVPTFYVDGKKIHEGVPSEKKIRNVFEEALK